MLLFSESNTIFCGHFDLGKIFLIMTINIFWGYQTDVSARKEPLVGVWLMRVGVLSSGSVLAEISIKSPRNYSFSLSKETFSVKAPRKHFIQF